MSLDVLLRMWGHMKRKVIVVYSNGWFVCNLFTVQNKIKLQKKRCLQRRIYLCERSLSVQNEVIKRSFVGRVHTPTEPNRTNEFFTELCRHFQNVTSLCWRRTSQGNPHALKEKSTANVWFSKLSHSGLEWWTWRLFALQINGIHLLGVCH